MEKLGSFQVKRSLEKVKDRLPIALCPVMLLIGHIHRITTFTYLWGLVDQI